ncbi:GNAT family N-acetyltransferase [Nocardia terpenica]|uniref:GNAT family N-acetyltransferase n=1 Tax=Nocardia terpenica TaxID=455432 RepID=UPI001895957D|nr:GNAT family N-acetyltransferase [Nocardia terpenica]MBF6066275.1 GNAT family N-acetyltransferase [Nocardia terpenica]MBF6108595.1 GNAT family N-acetyltransferase [Nocardia terpenica]MBF6116141.1 GNAT family N-acetyltransferase [Nocardia terpenica]MBF6123738.1 GNAT family N-acetyltransferase [Nocardia terpenica]MBF6157115.1 GNAT family N-acetyltransferase [Nocardia terpenica]
MAAYAEFPTSLLTQRLRLRQWLPSDAEEYHALWTERDVRSVRSFDAAGRPTVEEIRGRLLANPPGAEQGLGLLAVERRDTGGFIGYCGLIVGQGSHDEPEIAYELAQRAHGNGYATEAGWVVVEAAARTGRQRLWATVREWNTASFRVLEKLDFYHSGRVTPDPDRGDSIWMTRELDQPLA